MRKRTVAGSAVCAVMVAGMQLLAAEIDRETLDRWSAPYRNWHYWPTHVIPAEPKIPGHETFRNTDVPCVYQLPGQPGKWHMSYIAFNGKGYNSFVAESTDLIHWSNPRLAMGFGKEGEFDFGGCVIGAFLYESYDIKAPRILKKRDGRYWTLYGCYPKQGGYEIDPGYEGVATSDDGLAWRRAKDAPILSVHDADCARWEKNCIYQPWLVEHEGKFYNFYNAKHTPPYSEQMGLATSSDVLSWQRHRDNPIVRNRPGGYDSTFCADGKVFRDGDHWAMFYFGLGKGKGGAHIMIAFSQDLVNWTAHPEPLYKAGGHPGKLDKVHAHKISLVYRPANDTFYLYYCAVGNKGRGIGLITSKKDPPARKEAAAKDELPYPPVLPGGQAMVTDRAEAMLKSPATLRSGVAVARTPPTVDFAYYPGQTYPGKPWSNWGDSLAVGGKYYASIGDHLAPQGNAFVYEYDPAAKNLRCLVDVRRVLNLPEGHYTPGKIHGRLDLADDGWLYFSTHRGSTRATTDENHYRGDWILRHHPGEGKSEVVVCGPVPKHCIPGSVVDPQRLIFYGATAPGDNEGSGMFLAYDLKTRKVLCAEPNGPSRVMVLAQSTGRVYYVPGRAENSPLMRFDPRQGARPVEIPGKIGIRAATQETPQGAVYTVSQGGRAGDSLLYRFDVRTETVEELGPAAVGSQQYIASLDADPAGRRLYYVPGAHGGSDTDGSPLVQFDVRTRQKKVIAFLHPFYRERYGCALRGTFSLAVDPRGDKVYITWNASRGSRAWDCCALTVVHVPESER